MTDLFALDGPRFGPASGGKPRSLVLLLHGVGADGNDLIGLAPYFARGLPDTAFVSPNAPYPCDMAPYGYQWFSLQDRTPSVILSGVQATAPILSAFIDAERDRYGLEDRQVALLGFSQGTMMSLYVAPRRAKPVAGVVGFSGALVGADLLAEEARSKPPVLLIHGEADPIVPFAAMAAAGKALHGAGLAVETLARPGLPHSIDEEGMAAGIRFLTQALAVG
jgi:phospholipase/carboxylesterase